MDFSDHQLLKQYLNEGNHQAFTELVRRYLGLVHAAALRLCGNATLAEEVCQTVMGRLAGLRAAPPPSLPLVVWMHRNTRSATADLLRSENRRRHREATAASLRAMPHTPFPWEEIAPVLDEVIGGLPGGERELVLRRFFQGQSHAAIAAALGLSEDAARMRIKRALERMRGLLGKRGVTTTASALGLGLPAHAAVCPPAAGFAASVSSAALATAIPASFLSTLTAGLLTITMTMTGKTILIAGAALLLTGAVLVLNHAALLSPTAQAAVPPGAASAPPHSGTALASPRRVRVPAGVPAAAPENEGSPPAYSSPAGEAKTALRSQLETLRLHMAGLPEGPDKEADRALERAILERLGQVGYPTEKEISTFLELSRRSPESLGWVFAKTGDLNYLREGLDRDPENELLRFLAAAMPVDGTEGEKETEAASELSKASLQWLQQHKPGLHAALQTGEGKSLTPSVVEELNKADFVSLPEDLLRRLDREFLRSARGLTGKEAYGQSTAPGKFSIRKKLGNQAVLPGDPVSKAVSALALSRSHELDTLSLGLVTELILCGSMSDADLRTLLGDSRENLRSAVNSDIEQIQALADFRSALIAGGDEEAIRSFEQLRDQAGEINALRQLRDAAAEK